MKKTLLLLGALSFTALNAGFFEHNTDMKKSYEFNLKVSKEEKKLYQRLQDFQNNNITDEEILLFLETNTSSQLYTQDILIQFSSKQKNILNITDKEINNMYIQEDTSWFDNLRTLFEFNKKSKDKNVTIKGVESEVQ